MPGLNILGSELAVSGSDVVVSNIGLANAILRDSQGMLHEFQQVTGVALELTDIELDSVGRIVITKPELAEFIVAGQAAIVPEEFQDTANGICGLRC